MIVIASVAALAIHMRNKPLAPVEGEFKAEQASSETSEPREMAGLLKGEDYGDM